jgi:hypothetical protein
MTTHDVMRQIQETELLIAVGQPRGSFLTPRRREVDSNRWSHPHARQNAELALMSTLSRCFHDLN